MVKARKNELYKLKNESSLESVGRRAGLTAGEIDWETPATEKDG